MFLSLHKALNYETDVLSMYGHKLIDNIPMPTVKSLDFLREAPLI